MTSASQGTFRRSLLRNLALRSSRRSKGWFSLCSGAQRRRCRSRARTRRDAGLTAVLSMPQIVGPGAARRGMNEIERRPGFLADAPTAPLLESRPFLCGRRTTLPRLRRTCTASSATGSASSRTAAGSSAARATTAGFRRFTCRSSSRMRCGFPSQCRTSLFAGDYNNGRGG